MNNKLIFLPTLFLSQALWAGGNTGGMDGGGGGTLPAHPASVYEIQDIAQEAKPDLLYLLNGYEWREKFDQNSSLYQKLFKGPRKAQEVLKGLRLEVRLEQPCYTSGGTEVDASIYGLKENTICLSAFRISQKIDKAAVEREVFALLMHEISHFLGATESEAVELQKDISWWILNTKKGRLDGELIRTQFDRFNSSLRDSIEALRENDLEKVNARLYQSLLDLTKFVSTTYTSPYRLFPEVDSQYQDLLRLKLSWAQNFTETLIPGDEQQEVLKNYNKIFGSRDYFVANEDSGWPKEHLYSNERVQKIKSLVDLEKTLSDLAREYQIRSAYTNQATFGMHWINLKGHLTAPKTNPWEKFVGHYVVESTQCENPQKADEIEFAVEKSPAGLFFRRIYKSSGLADRIDFGIYNINMYLNNYGETKDGGVFMTHEMGGSWSMREYAHSNVSTLTLNRFADGRFELSRMTSYLNKDVTKQDIITKCVFKGIVK